MAESFGAVEGSLLQTMILRAALRSYPIFLPLMEFLIAVSTPRLGVDGASSLGFHASRVIHAVEWYSLVSVMVTLQLDFLAWGRSQGGVSGAGPSWRTERRSQAMGVGS